MRAGVGCLPGCRPEAAVPTLESQASGRGEGPGAEGEASKRCVDVGGGVRDTSPEVTFNQQVATTSPDSQRQIPG